MQIMVCSPCEERLEWTVVPFPSDAACGAGDGLVARGDPFRGPGDGAVGAPTWIRPDPFSYVFNRVHSFGVTFTATFDFSDGHQRIVNAASTTPSNASVSTDSDMSRYTRVGHD